MLGFNDLGWFFSDDDGLISNMKILIDNARRVNPSLKIVIGTVPHRTYIGGRNDLVTMTDAYNRKLKTQVGGWATSTSPVCTTISCVTPILIVCLFRLYGHRSAKSTTVSAQLPRFS